MSKNTCKERSRFGFRLSGAALISHFASVVFFSVGLVCWGIAPAIQSCIVVLRPLMSFA